MDNKDIYEYDKEIKGIFSGMESYVKMPLNIEESIMQKIESEKDYSQELKVLRKKVRIGQLLLLALGFTLVIIFFWPVITQSSILSSEGSDFDMLPTLYSLFILALGFSYLRIKTQWKED